MTVKKRIVSFLLALVMAASCVPTALAAGEGRMAVAVSTAEGVVIAPQYVDCAQGETVWQVLSRMEGHTFTQGAGSTAPATISWKNPQQRRARSCSRTRR